jgi:hypothetical protein
MKTIKSMIEALRRFPEDAICYAYEGEVTGVVIVVRDKVQTFKQETLGVIWATENDEEDTRVDDARAADLDAK